jgi:transposase
MEITEEQYARIQDSLPVQRGNMSLSNLQFLNAVLYVAEHGCKWRGLPKLLCRLSSNASFVSASSISRPNQPRYVAFSASGAITVPKLEDDERVFNMTDITCARLVAARTINSKGKAI